MLQKTGTVKMNLLTSLLLVASLPLFLLLCSCSQQPAYKNTHLSVDKRVDDLVSRMTVEEKISQMSHLAPAIERLGVIEYGPHFYNPLMQGEHPDYSR